MKIDHTPPEWLNDPQARLARKNAFDASLAVGTANFNRNTGRLNAKTRPFLWALDQATGLIRADLVRVRRCPVCDAPPGTGLFIKDGFRHVKCPNCGLIYVSLILREDIMEKYWREETAWSAVLGSAPQMEMDRLKYQYGLDLVSWRVPGRRLLDIGSGPGGFIRLAGEAGWETTALELSLENSRRMAADGHKVIVKQLETADLPSKSFDLICLWEVLEHLAEPGLTLAESKRLLIPGGLLLLMVPNVQSLVTRLLHDKSNTFGGHSHLNHFAPRTIAAILKKAGLTLLEMETVITELGAINNHLAFEDPYGGSAETFTEDLTPELIHRHLWGSRLLVVAGV
ncbi:MAG: class I SAM-dependent methyltransferase [Candidatus Adiutrix sp.]|nr:class I SAM-dependent methyltransferase [Candidatus Adiutrix sp.]